MALGEFSKPRRLDPDDDISGFQCGVGLVDAWLRDHARKAEKQRTAVVYASFAANGELAGFYTLNAYGVERDRAGGWLKRNSPDPVPVLLLGMLGVDIRFQTRHLGGMLLRDAVERALGVSDIVGARALMVEPANDKAGGFYGRYGFRTIRDSGMMFLPLSH
ncbi:GNAT family N-acetyltransferase [Bifidobacterium simiarum]|uniref:GNAT family N-acetyltransferase n=1 Tax=Bifidobacterium simiarum TaxID=2045441 RepID=UPI001BDCD65D|nr:GNAT family N-acetyltransferase [Bifidobacterium simiarum]MBT1167275.1 GNAT family N-acetyltransferase [Bifidobacterium simiarum]